MGGKGRFRGLGARRREGVEGSSTHLTRKPLGLRRVLVGEAGPVDLWPDARASAVWHVPADMGGCYAWVSGDVHPIHLSWLAARALRFPRAQVHGTLTKADGFGGHRDTTARGVCRGRRLQPAAAALGRQFRCGATEPGVGLRRPTGAKGREPSFMAPSGRSEAAGGCVLPKQCCGDTDPTGAGRDKRPFLNRRVARFAC
jgi:MaoC like domain